MYLPLVTDSDTFTVNGNTVNVNDCKVENNCVILERAPGKYVFEL